MAPPHAAGPRITESDRYMVVLGIVLLIIGLVVASLKILLWIGIILIVVGLVVNLLPIGGTRRRIY